MSSLSIQSITFSNFKALVQTTLPLGQFTLIVGPNGSGKSTALQAIELLQKTLAEQPMFAKLLSVTRLGDPDAKPQLKLTWDGLPPGSSISLQWEQSSNAGLVSNVSENERVGRFLMEMRVYSLDPAMLPGSVTLQPRRELDRNGSGLSGVLDRLRDEAPERFEALNDELGRWLPEFDRILFDTPQQGHRSIRLRTRSGKHAIPADNLSQGTLLALTILTLAYLPQPPSLVGLEEPDRGIHPRLLREVRDALYRLAYPESFGETRPPVQVVATTQSPYFLDLFREHPEEIVIAEKKGLEAQFVPLSAHPHIGEILADASLGEVWYSGVLGGVPVPS
jgi:predicted ATPase